MADELENDDEAIFEDAEDGESDDKGHGPGFIRGLLFGVIAGAVATKLFGPSEAGETNTQAALDSDEATGRLRDVLAGVKERFQEASKEAGEAMRESEAASRAHLEELIKKQA